ncbi:VCBS repeat-containing protein, partial [Citreicella sp. C3M06]|uniref:FG-GAP repeat domain-containing protein n=1 Tax=Citreicella sp. C3M06 TaxID=2841564 RepID=UPI001C0833D8
ICATKPTVMVNTLQWWHGDSATANARREEGMSIQYEYDLQTYNAGANITGTGYRPFTQEEGTYTWQTTVEEFNGDGHVDILQGIDGGLFKIHNGDGNGNFTQGAEPIPEVSGHTRGAGFSAIDLNGDGLLDLIGMQASGASKLAVFINQTDASGNPAWSGDIAASTPTLGFVESNAGPAAADISHDGYYEQIALEIETVNSVLQTNASMTAARMRATT